jgi:succinate dehydrogenase/fumarate reductase flavoprotein subunit
MSVHDAVLIGASAGSLIAAIALAESGLHPVIVEKSDRVGGGTAYSGGIVWAPRNHRMRAKGKSDSVADAMMYLSAIGGRRWSPVVAGRYVNEVPRVLEYVEQTTELTWVTYVGLPDYFAETPGGKMGGRCVMPLPARKSAELRAALARHPETALVREVLHAPGQEAEWIWGRAVIGALWARALDLGIEYRMSTPAERLVFDGDRVTGVEVRTADGLEILEARLGVLLNTGGFEWNPSLTADLLDPPLPFPHTPPANEGDGHRMAAELGAAMELMDKTIGISSVQVPGGTNDGSDLYQIFFQPLSLPHAIVVNRAGRRFANETFFDDLVEGWRGRDAFGEFENLPSWVVFDQQYVEAYGLPEGLRLDANVEAHATLEALAAHHGIDAVGLQHQVNEFNAVVRSGGGGSFERGTRAYHRAFGDPRVLPNPTLGTVATAPFYAAQLHLATSGHRGGASIDSRARVIHEQGHAIEGLFACGNAAAGTVTGEHYISGATLGHSLVFGAVAAEEMIVLAARMANHLSEG